MPDHGLPGRLLPCAYLSGFRACRAHTSVCQVGKYQQVARACNEKCIRDAKSSAESCSAVLCLRNSAWSPRCAVAFSLRSLNATGADGAAPLSLEADRGCRDAFRSFSGDCRAPRGMLLHWHRRVDAYFAGRNGAGATVLSSPECSRCAPAPHASKPRQPSRANQPHSCRRVAFSPACSRGQRPPGQNLRAVLPMRVSAIMSSSSLDGSGPCADIPRYDLRWHPARVSGLPVRLCSCTRAVRSRRPTDSSSRRWCRKAISYSTRWLC